MVTRAGTKASFLGGRTMNNFLQRSIGVLALVIVGTGAQADPLLLAPTTATHTPAQLAWLQATLDQRIKLAELIGEDGARAFAKSKGYQPLYDGLNRTLPQGPDQVYLALDGRVIVFEAKG